MRRGMGNSGKMISYNVFFSPKNGVEEERLIAAAHGFLGNLKTAGRLRGYRILRVTNPASFPALPRFQVIMDFDSQQQLDDSMSFMRQPGKVHGGPHGEIVGMVAEFKVSFAADA